MARQLTQQLEGHRGSIQILGFYGKKGGATELLTPAEEPGFILGQDGFSAGGREWQGFYHEDTSSPRGWRGPTGQMTSEVLTGTFQGGG